MENWHAAAKEYLAKLGHAEWISQGRPTGKRRYAPSAYHSQLIDCLNRDDEQGFKALKLESGYSSEAKS